MKAKLWIVEMWNRHAQRWEPTVGAGLSREDGKRERQRWVEDDPSDRFRLAAYVREAGPK